MAPSQLQQLIDEILFQRAKEMRNLLKDDHGFVMVHGTAFWTDLFVRNFIFEEDCSAQESDDLLFFIRNRQQRQANKTTARVETVVDVMRRDSKRLPIGDPEIDWQQTVYVNTVVHQLHYYVTLAVCTRTSARELQVLHRRTERVWASPSRRCMSEKGSSEEITYPNMCFMLDNFDQVFDDVVVRDGEMVCVELVARTRAGHCQCVLFLGSVRYDALKRIYDSRASAGVKMAHLLSFGLLCSTSSRRMEFVRVKGPYGKGHAEMVVCKPPGGGCETPASEPGFSLTERDNSDSESELVLPSPSEGASVAVVLHTHKRRSSDPSSSLASFMYGRMQCESSMQRASSHAATLQRCGAATHETSSNIAVDDGVAAEIQAGNMNDAATVATRRWRQCRCRRPHSRLVAHYRCTVQQDYLARHKLDDGAYNPIWTMRGCRQVFHFWKESRRSGSVPLNAFLTYIMLPCCTIMHDLLTKECRQGPILTF